MNQFNEEQQMEKLKWKPGSFKPYRIKLPKKKTLLMYSPEHLLLKELEAGITAEPKLICVTKINFDIK